MTSDGRESSIEGGGSSRKGSKSKGGHPKQEELQLVRGLWNGERLKGRCESSLSVARMRSLSIGSRFSSFLHDFSFCFPLGFDRGLEAVYYMWPVHEEAGGIHSACSLLPAGGDQASLWKLLTVSTLTPLFPSPQIDFSADQIEGEYEQPYFPLSAAFFFWRKRRRHRPGHFLWINSFNSHNNPTQ